jgi:nitrate/nitrite transporter NarK
MVTSDPPDPVRARRQRIGAAAGRAKRAGYGLFGVAVVAFVAATLAQFPPALVTVVIVCLAVGSLLLAPAIVIAYGVKAAEREDPERGERS